MDMKDDEKTNLVRWKFWGENERVAMFHKTPKPRTPAFPQFLSPLPYDTKEASCRFVQRIRLFAVQKPPTKSGWNSPRRFFHGKLHHAIQLQMVIVAHKIWKLTQIFSDIHLVNLVIFHQPPILPNVACLFGEDSWRDVVIIHQSSEMTFTESPHIICRYIYLYSDIHI